MRVEINQQAASSAAQVSSEVDAKFESASAGFQAEQTRLNEILQAQHSRLTELVDKLSAEVNEAVQKVSTVSEGKLDQVATAILEQQNKMAEYESKAEAIKQAGVEKVDTVHQILSAEVRLMHGDITNNMHGAMHRVEQLEQAMSGAGANAQRFDMSGGPAPGGAPGYQIWPNGVEPHGVEEW